LAALSVGVSLSALSTTIPADLEARAAALRSHATPATLAWVHERGVALGKSGAPVDVGALRTSAQTNWAVLGTMQGADIEAICFLVLMEASKSAQEDLKAIMDGVKGINQSKQQQRAILSAGKSSIAASPTPTPAPDRVAQLVAAARRIEPKTASANLSRVSRR
jgi:hypothetical protein